MLRFEQPTKHPPKRPQIFLDLDEYERRMSEALARHFEFDLADWLKRLLQRIRGH